MRVLGIDEAGRGCVLGALVVAGFLCEGDDEALRAAGARDSKQLSAARRDAAALALRPLGTPDVREISPTEIDEGNLNTLEERLIIALIVAHRPDLVYLDALGHPKTLPAVALRLLGELAPHGLAPTLIIEPKADDRYATVSAASIFAKTHRDAQLERLKAAWGDFGSGYPSDPKTRTWLAAHHRSGAPWPAFVRTRWGTVRALSQPELF
jgi:ribonuclease HII